MRRDTATGLSAKRTTPQGRRLRVIPGRRWFLIGGYRQDRELGSNTGFGKGGERPEEREYPLRVEVTVADPERMIPVAHGDKSVPGRLTS